MRLIDTVSLFSTETFTDVFDTSITFKGKLNPFAEVANSGESSRRRILETPVDQVIPAARIIESPEAETFIVAAANHDFWKGTAIRHKYPILPADVMGSVGDIGETLGTTQPDQQVYSYVHFVRRELNEEERSDYLSGYEAYFSQVKSFEKGSILTRGSQVYRLKTDTWIDGAGFSVAQVVRLDNALQTLDIVYDKESYDPVTDTYPGVSALATPCFVEPLKQDYEFITPSFTKIEAGDKAISVLKAGLSIGVNDRIGDYRVQSIRDSGTWITCQCRRLS